MTFRKFLYDYILAQGFRLQDYPKLFLWIPILGNVYRIKRRKELNNITIDEKTFVKYFVAVSGTKI